MAAKRARVPCGVGAGFWTARCSASKFDDAASARDRDLMMRTAGARIMSISGARRAQTSPGLPADAHDAGFWRGQDGRDYCPVHELALPAPGAALKYMTENIEVRKTTLQHAVHARRSKDEVVGKAVYMQAQHFQALEHGEVKNFQTPKLDENWW